jgi:hypothetical protein
MLGTPGDVALGLMFTYFILGALVSQLNDWLSSLFSWRQKDLEKAMVQLVGPRMADDILTHPVVSPFGERPSAIAPAVFAQVFSERTVTLGPESTLRYGFLLSDRDPTKLKEDAVRWFNSAMEQVSALYRKRMRIVSFVVSLIIVSVVGIDSLNLATRLWQEPMLRASLTGAVSSTSTIQESSDRFGAVAQTISTIQFPWGWSGLPSTLGDWLQKVAGLLLTTLASSLGAPFWYNLLKQVSPPTTYGPTVSPTGKGA